MVDKKKFAEEEALGYDVNIMGKNFQVTEPMRQHIWNKLQKIERFHNHIFHVHITLEIRRLDHVCTILCHFNHLQMKVEADSTDMYASIDRAMQKLQTLFRKWKSRIQDYHKKPLQVVDMTVNLFRRPLEDATDEINREIEAVNLEKWAPGKIVATEKRPLKTLTTDEAIMKMELSGDPFMLYRDESESTPKLKLIYRHSDENYGIIQVE
jgi:putative sigma-54 modulation protein